MKLIVNKASRLAKARAHTATHLLHAELDRLLNGTKQAGSLVDEDYLRLDFTASKPLTDDQILELEKKVNNYIYQALPVEKVEMSFEKAKKLWAKAFFDEKYGDVVRVVAVRDACKWEWYISIELCGWTHVDNTFWIWSFKIIWQEAVASGIRRLVAVTGPKVAEKFIEQENILKNIASSLECSVKQIEDKLSKLQKENKDLKSAYQSLQEQLLIDNLKKFFEQASSNNQFDAVIFVPSKWVFENINFKNLWNIAKNLYWNINFLIYNSAWNFFAYSWRQNIDLKKWLQDNKLKWWWNQYQVQWKDEKILQLFKN